MATVSSLTKHFITAHESFSDNLSGSITGGSSTTVAVNSAAEYSTGDVCAWTISPGTANQRTVVGTVNGNQIENCVWTEGSYTGTYSVGTTVIDYHSATHQAALVKGLKVEHDQDGTHSTITGTSIDLSGGADIGGTFNADGAATLGSSLAIADKTLTKEDESGNVVAADPFQRGEARIFDFVYTGLNPSSASGLTVTIPLGTYYIAGKRYTYAGGTKLLTASKDCYLDINTSGTITAVEVANGATTGMTLTANSVRFAKCVTDGSGVTSYTLTGLDPIGNPIRHKNPYMRTIDYSTTVQGGNFTGTSTSLADVTNTTFEYRTGDTPERLFLCLEGAMSNSGANNTFLGLSVGGTDQTDFAYHGATTNFKMGCHYVVDVAASTQVTIKARYKVAAGTITVIQNTAGIVPTIKGHAIRIV